MGQAYRVEVYAELNLSCDPIRIVFRDCLVMKDETNNETIWGSFKLNCPIDFIEFEKV